MQYGNLLCCCCCCFSPDDSTTERSLLKPSWFDKVAGSNPGAQDEDSVKWWRQGWKSVRQAGESVVEDHLGPKWKRFLRKCRAGEIFICKSKPGRFNYDRVSYELNFDEGCRDFSDYQNEGFSKVSDEDGTRTAQRINKYTPEKVRNPRGFSE